MDVLSVNMLDIRGVFGKFVEFCYKNCCDHRIRTKIYLRQIQQYFNVFTENGYSKPKTRLLMAITKTLGMPTRSTPESSKNDVATSSDVHLLQRT